MARLRSLLRKGAFLVAFGTAVLGISQPTLGTDLDDYVSAPDPSYSYTLVATAPGVGYTDYVVDMISQTWLTPEEVDRTEWQHYLTITVPDTVAGTTGLLYIGSGDNDDAPPSGNSSSFRNIALDTGSVVGYLRQVPNQPLTFAGDVPRWEDAQIAYTWDQFLRGADSVWLSRMPMTKAAVRAMDTISAVAADEASVTVDSYVVAGGSKRGWTTWTTAAVDSRVIAFAPMVIDLLNIEPSFVHHYSALGYWAPAIHDYVEMDIPLWFGTRPFRDLLDLVDPYSYRDRYTIPKYIINSSGDEFFLPDSSQFYFDDLPGEKHIRYVPNTGHGLNQSAWNTFEAWYWAILTDTPRPQFSWMKQPDGSIIVNTTRDTPSQVLLWQATNPTAREFFSYSGAYYTSSVLAPTQPGEYHAQVALPPSGWTAFFVELRYASSGPESFVFTTEVSVVPDTYPYSFDPDTDEDGLPNSTDTDDDNDGEPDATDYRPLDTDDDALPNPIDEDDDGDGIADTDEGTDDPDGDALPNYLDTDSDGDGISDTDEGADDPDGDGAPNYLDTDSDDDGISDTDEGTDDTDGDGLPNYLDTDSDDDGISDTDEGTDDTDGDGLPNYLDTDSDDDGIADTDEGTDDTDGDGLPNYLDTDSDDDGFADGDEVASGSDPYDPDSVPTFNRGGSGAPCFVASAAYGTAAQKEVGVLCDFRDRCLLTNRVGAAFVRTYYRFSPRAARFIAAHEPLRAAVRACLAPSMAIVRLTTVFPLRVVFIGFVIVTLGVLLLTRRKEASLFRTGVRR